MKITYTTESPAKEYGDVLRKAKNLKELLIGVEFYKKVAPDAIKKIKKMTDADFLQFKKDLPKLKNAKGKMAEELEKKWGDIILPRILLLTSLMEMQFKVPWGCAFIRGKELKQF